MLTSPLCPSALRLVRCFLLTNPWVVPPYHLFFDNIFFHVTWKYNMYLYYFKLITSAKEAKLRCQDRYIYLTDEVKYKNQYDICWAEKMYVEHS
jgi:hypothetical protein